MGRSSVTKTSLTAMVALGVAVVVPVLAAAAPASAAQGAVSSVVRADSDDDDDDDEDTDGLRLVTSSLPAMLPGQRAWGSLLWTTDAKVCNVAVTASASGAGFTYPTNTASFSSFYKGSSLEKSAVDYTALNVSVPTTTTKAVSVTVTARYTMVSSSGDDDDRSSSSTTCSSRVRTSTYRVTLPVTTPSGPAVTLKTTTATVGTTAPAWVPLSFVGNRAGLENVRVQVKAPSGLAVVYPKDSTSSGLAHDTGLPAGGTDFAAVRLDASGLRQGTYSVPVVATWTGGSLESVLTLTVN